MIVEDSRSLITASAAVGSSVKGKGEERFTGITSDSPGPCGRKDSRSHGINYEQVTVALRHLRRRRSLLRLRCRLRTEEALALERMCKGRGGNGLRPNCSVYWILQCTRICWRVQGARARALSGRCLGVFPDLQWAPSCSEALLRSPLFSLTVCSQLKVCTPEYAPSYTNLCRALLQWG